MKEQKKIGHAQHLKAVNHPIRREMLKKINEETVILKQDLMNYLRANNVVEQEDVFNYNMDFLLQAQCVKKLTENGVVSYEILPGGKVVEYFS